MRAVVLTTSYPRAQHDPSGHFVQSFARELAEGGADVHVIAPFGALLDRPRRDEILGKPSAVVTLHAAGGGDLFTWPGAIARAKESPRRLMGAASFAAGALVRMRSIAAAGPIDHLAAHWIVPSAYPIAVASMAAARVRPSSFEVVAHGADVRLLLRLPALVRARVLATLLDRGARFVFAASALRDALIDGAPPWIASPLASRSRVKAPPIDVHVDAPTREAIASRFGDRSFVVVVARLVADKRVELAIRAIARVRADVVLVVVGDGPDRARLEAIAEEVAPGRVVFVGMLPRDRALAWIAAARLLLHPSAVEAAPTAVREARALRVPVIACAAGDVEAWAASDAGLRVVPPRADAIAIACEEVLAI